MSAFEFVIVAFAIILGLGVSEVLSGWADQIRARDRVRPYPLQLASSGFVLYLSIQYLFLLWHGRGIEWTFARFLAIAGPALALALAARVSKVDTAPDARSIREQYFHNSPAVYGLLAVFPALVILMSLFSDLRGMIPNPPNLVAVSIVRVGLLLIYFGLARSKSERFHWIGLCLMWLTAIGFVVRLGPNLTGAPG